MNVLKKQVINTIDNNNQRTLEIADFLAVDAEKACIHGAKFPAMDAVTLLRNDASAACEIAALPRYHG